MRKGNAFLVSVVSCSTLFGAWRIGLTHGVPTAESVQVVSPPSLLGASVSAASGTPSPTLPSTPSSSPAATTTTPPSATGTAQQTPRPHPTTTHPTAPTPQRKPTAKPTPKPTPTPTERTQVGALVQTPYGDVQVEVAVLGTRLLNVTALRLTDSSSRSVQISAQAAPILRREALTAQSARIDAVSGASYTSQGYIVSLQSALDAARAAA